MDQNRPLPAEDLRAWENFYRQTLTRDGNESMIETGGEKQLILLPILSYTLISTMLQKLKYLPSQCFNRIAIGGTPVCGLRPLERSSPPLMVKLTEILRPIVDGIRKQQIQSVTMIFYQKNNINTIYDSYTLMFDYSITLPENETTTSISLIARLIYQIEYLFDWNDPLPADVELSFVASALDQFDNDERKLPSPLTFVKATMKKVYAENETNHLLGRLTTPDGKLWLKFLPTNRPLSGSTVRSEDLPTKANLFPGQTKTTDKAAKLVTPVAQPTNVASPKLKKKTMRSSISTDSSKSGGNLPSLITSVPTKAKKRSGLLSAVKSLITPSRTPAPVKSSTPNLNDLVLIRHTSTPKPGETASRIIIEGRESLPALSAIQESNTPDVRPVVHSDSPTPSTITATDISTALTPTLTIDRRSTVRGQAAIARKKIAAMQIREDVNESDDDDDDDEDEEFNKLFSQRRSKKSKNSPLVSRKNLHDVSSLSSSTSNTESLFTPPTGRKRPPTDQSDLVDSTLEHGTPPKTPRTARRNRISDQSTSIQHSPMDIGDVQVTVDSPRLLRSITKKLQQQATTKKQAEYEEESGASQETTNQDEEVDRVYVRLERSSIALHYSMDESD